MTYPLRFAFFAIVASLLILAPLHRAPAADAVTLQVEKSSEYGPYLTDGQGRSLYLFTKDERGQSNCYDACAEVWPPLTASGEAQAGERVDAALISTIERKDGTTQVTYGGWPLYYFAKDQGAGQTKGQDVHGFGGEWYLVSPQGKKATGEEHH